VYPSHETNSTEGKDRNGKPAIEKKRGWIGVPNGSISHFTPHLEDIIVPISRIIKRAA
jgi:hypothetical protein